MHAPARCGSVMLPVSVANWKPWSFSLPASHCSESAKLEKTSVLACGSRLRRSCSSLRSACARGAGGIYMIRK